MGKHHDVDPGDAVTERDLELLSDLAWARFLSVRQVERLHFPSIRTAQRRLAVLERLGLVRLHLQGEARHLPRIATLAPFGATVLTNHGRTSSGPTRAPRLQKLRHGLAIRDAFVAFRCAAHARRIVLHDFRFEEELVSEPAFRDHRLIPDAAALVERPRAVLLGLEVDLGTETTTVLRAKLAAWRACLAARPPEAVPLRVVFLCASPRRAKTVRRLSEEARLEPLVLLASDLEDEIPALVGQTGALFVPLVRAVRIGTTEERARFQGLGE